MTGLIFGYQITVNNFDFDFFFFDSATQWLSGNIMFAFGCVTSFHFPIMDLIEWGFRVDQISARSSWWLSKDFQEKGGGGRVFERVWKGSEGTLLFTVYWVELIKWGGISDGMMGWDNWWVDDGMMGWWYKWRDERDGRAVCKAVEGISICRNDFHEYEGISIFYTLSDVSLWYIYIFFSSRWGIGFVILWLLDLLKDIMDEVWRMKSDRWSYMVYDVWGIVYEA